MITYIGTSGGAVLVRGHSYRVVLRGALDLDFVLNITDWRGFVARVDRWRADAASGRTGVAALVSAPAISGDGSTNIQQRAVLDLQVLGGTVGDMSVSQWASEMDRLVPGIDVVSVARINAPSESERGAVLATAQAEARDPFGLRATGATVVRLLTLLAVVAAVFAVSSTIKAVKS